MSDDAHEIKETKSEEDKEKSTKSPKEILKNIDAAKKWIRNGFYEVEDARWNKWERDRKLLNCIWPDRDNADDIAVNKVFANVNTMRPILYFKNPRVVVTPKKPSFKRDAMGDQVLGDDGRPVLVDNYKAGKLFGLKLNHIIDEVGLKTVVKRSLVDSMCPYGVGWVKVGYSVDETVGGINNDDKEITYWVDRLDPRQVGYDPFTTDWKKCSFFYEEIVTSKVKAEEFGIKVPANYSCKLPKFLESRDDKKNSRNSEMVVFYEYHCHDTNKVYWVWPDGEGSKAGEFAKEPVDKTHVFEGPDYVPLVLNPNNEDVIGLSDAVPIEDQVRAVNRIRTKMQKHIENFGTLTTYEENSILEHNIDNIRKNDHGAFLKLEAGGTGKVRREPTPPIGNDNYQLASVHEEDGRATLGITDYQTGAAQSRMATEAQIIQNALAIRIEERKDEIADFFIEIIRRLASLVMLKAEEEDFIDLSDEVLGDDFVEWLRKEKGFNPNIPFLHMSKEDIQGEWNFKINIEDMLVVPKETQLQKFNQFLQTIFSNQFALQEFNKNYDLSKVIKKWAELSSIDLDEIKRGGPIMLGSAQENIMFMEGMEVPEPHEKDHDDEHNFSHGLLMQNIQSQIGSIEQPAKQILSEVSKKIQAVQASGDQMLIEQMSQMAEAEKQKAIAMMQQAEPLKEILRKIQVHMSFHEMKQRALEPQQVPNPQQMQQNAPL